MQWTIMGCGTGVGTNDDDYNHDHEVDEEEEVYDDADNRYGGNVNFTITEYEDQWHKSLYKKDMAIFWRDWFHAPKISDQEPSFLFFDLHFKTHHGKNHNFFVKNSNAQFLLIILASLGMKWVPKWLIKKSRLKSIVIFCAKGTCGGMTTS